MNCQTCQSELEDLLYGEVEAARQPALHEHLSVCAECRAVQTALERENELFAQYYEQTAVEPPDEMWQAIHVRIQGVRTPSTGWRERLRGWPLLAPAMLRQIGVAALLILLSVGLTTMYFSLRKSDQHVAERKPSLTVLPTAMPSAPPPIATPHSTESARPLQATNKIMKSEPKPAATPRLSEADALTLQIAIATREYQGAIKLLERTIAKRKPELDEGTIKQFEGSLAMIDASIAASRQAMQAHPNDPTAARYLLTAYSKKVDLMQEIAMR